MDSWRRTLDALKIRVAVARIGNVPPDDFEAFCERLRGHSVIKLGVLQPANGTADR